MMRAEPEEQRGIERIAGLLAELAVHERNAIQRASDMQFRAAGDVLLRAHTRSRSAFFPINAVVSVVRLLNDNRSVEVGLIGNEGMVGMDVLLDARNDLDEVVVQSAGFVYCMPVDDLRHLFDATARLQKSIFRFTHTFLGQVSQNAVCSRYHAPRQRVAKWLLMIDDRSGRLETGKSSQLLAAALCAGEPEMAEALAELTSAGAVQQRRSALAIRREVLETGACECYETMRMQ
jgi:CRP-like cAMP-binding protein